MKQQVNKLLTPDEATSNAGMVEQDPLSEAAGGVNTDFPCLAPDRLGTFIVKKGSKTTNEKGTQFTTLKVAIHEKELAFRDGKPARVGFAFNQMVNFTPTEKFDVDSVKRNAALWIKALKGVEAAKTTPISALRDNPETFEGLVFQARTGISKDKNGVYPDSTQLTPVLPA